VAELQEGTVAGHQWAVACEALAGEDSLGDAFVIHEGDGRLLVAVIDGLGHGLGMRTMRRVPWPPPSARSSTGSSSTSSSTAMPRPSARAAWS
jgi:hypothetical protein